jgi:hypothetical protein
MESAIARPAHGEYVEYYAPYIARVPDGNIVAILEKQREDTRRVLSGLHDAQAMHRYAPGKWSVKEVVGHVCDAERVFAYRALRFARGDRTALPGFDERAWVPAGRFDARTIASLVDELGAVRNATVALLRGLPHEASLQIGEANGAAVSVRALAFIIAGHEAHHVAVLRERYGVGN